MSISLSYLTAISIAQACQNVTFCLVLPQDVAESEFVKRVCKLERKADVEALSKKWSYHLVEVQPGLVAVLPNHTKLEQFIESRRAVFENAILDKAGDYTRPVGQLTTLSSLSKLCRNAVVPAMREVGLDANDSTLVHFEVDADLRLSLGQKMVTIPFSRMRNLSKTSEAEGKLHPTVYDRNKVGGLQDTLAQAFSRRPNVEISTENLSIRTWGAVKTNSRISTFAQLAFKQLSDEYLALEQTALRDESRFAASLGQQGADWKALGAAVGQPVRTLPRNIWLDLSGSLYQNALAMELTDQASVDRYLHEATVVSIRYTISCMTFAKFPDGHTTHMGVGLL
jgi:hypothetical protein